MAMADWAVFGGFLLVAGRLVLLAVALGAVLFSYIADEEAKGRRIDWLEEPLAMPGVPKQVEREILQKAA